MSRIDILTSSDLFLNYMQVMLVLVLYSILRGHSVWSGINGECKQKAFLEKGLKY